MIFRGSGTLLHHICGIHDRYPLLLAPLIPILLQREDTYINAVDDEGHTALHKLLIILGPISMSSITALVHSGHSINLNLTDNSGRTPLFLAAQRRHNGVV